MTAKFAKTAVVTASVIAIVAALLAYPALTTANAQTSTSSQTTSPSGTSSWTGGTDQAWAPGTGGMGPPPQGGRGMGGPGFGGPQGRVSVPVGQKITFTSTRGEYFIVGTPSKNGTASGSVAFTVSGNLTEGYTLSVSGSVVVGGTTYTVSSGSGQMSPSASAISGQGATSPSGAFILKGTARGSFIGTAATLTLDLQSGSTEYLVLLNGTVQS